VGAAPLAAAGAVVGLAAGVLVALLPPQAARMAAAALAATPPRKPRRESRETRMFVSSILFPHNPHRMSDEKGHRPSPTDARSEQSGSTQSAA
jgi:hypothetical protein